MRIWDSVARGIKSAMDDIRHKVIERPTYGYETTPRTQTVMLGTDSDKSMADLIGWTRSDGKDAAAHKRDAQEHDRGIDL